MARYNAYDRDVNKLIRNISDLIEAETKAINNGHRLAGDNIVAIALKDYRIRMAKKLYTKAKHEMDERTMEWAQTNKE